ncbi:MAG: ferrous iron transporter B [Sphingopyxis sp.]
MTSATPLVALVGNPNAGKSSLFNALTGARQKIANYPGVTVERHSGRGRFADGRAIDFIDLPGTYSLTPSSPDEAVTHDVLVGSQDGERRPDAMIIVVDAGNLPHHLRFVLELLPLGLPVIVALNMVDMAEHDGLILDAERLAQALGVPVVSTVAVRRRGLDALLDSLDSVLIAGNQQTAISIPHEQRAVAADQLARQAIISETPSRNWTRAIDNLLLHPILGVIILLAILFAIFQAVFTLAQWPIDALGGGVAIFSDWVRAILPQGFWRDLIIEGGIAGVGAVITFLPQILILFFFILLLEASGYMARAAFLMDGLMARIGLSGRGFIPLLSSFACAVPGIMATRAIADPKDRLTTILIAPLMTCSARLPVYAIIISAFIPARTIGFGVGLQGVVLFALYLTGVLAALLAAWVLRRTITRGGKTSLLMELPRYQWPRLSDLLLGLWQRAIVFLRRAGTIIFTTNILLWLMLSFPQVPAGSTANQLDYSVGGQIASAIEVVVRPIGFNHDIAIALLPAMAAREVAVSALATAYAIDGGDDVAMAHRLENKLSSRWSLATALAFLAWFVFAPQCISTIAVTRRETNGWKWPAFMIGYLFALAYGAAGATYWVAVAFGLG